MNTKILRFVDKKLGEMFSLPKYRQIVFQEDTIIKQLPWTPARFAKFQNAIAEEFGFNNINFDGTVRDLVDNIDEKYNERFWGQGIWQPRTDQYQYTGWGLVDEIMKHEPKAVLDVGCGYNQFKPRIPNLVGIDKYNNSADFMVDIMDYNVEPETYDAVIVLGSINFGSYEDVSVRFKKVFELTAPKGRVYVRANPGETHKNGPYIEIYPWDFDSVYRIAKEHNVNLITLKKDNGNRLFFVFEKC